MSGSVVRELRTITGRFLWPRFRVVPADGFQQVEGAPRRVEFSEHDQLGRAGACECLGVTGGAGKLGRMAVGGELLNERPSEVRVGLDDEDRLAAGARRGLPDGDALRTHAAITPGVPPRLAWCSSERKAVGGTP